jgi:hypothetical protein
VPKSQVPKSQVPAVAPVSLTKQVNASSAYRPANSANQVVNKPSVAHDKQDAKQPAKQPAKQDETAAEALVTFQKMMEQARIQRQQQAQQQQQQAPVPVQGPEPVLAVQPVSQTALP